jgi:hypothetical protein
VINDSKPSAGICATPAPATIQNSVVSLQILNRSHCSEF